MLLCSYRQYPLRSRNNEKPFILGDQCLISFTNNPANKMYTNVKRNPKKKKKLQEFGNPQINFLIKVKDEVPGKKAEAKTAYSEFNQTLSIHHINFTETPECEQMMMMMKNIRWGKSI